jgi:hypothetical protein
LRAQAGRDPSERYDIVAALPPGEDPMPYAAAGATWRLVGPKSDAATLDQPRAVVREGPAPRG